MSGRLLALVAELARPAPGSPASRWDAVRALLGADLTIAVTGRRGVGKTRLVEALTASPVNRGRRFLELPDQAGPAIAATLAEVARAQPDLVVHVARRSPRTDELNLLEAAAEAWGLEPVDVVLLVDSADEDVRRRVLRARRRPFSQVVRASLGPVPEGVGIDAVEAALRDGAPLAEARRALAALALLTGPGGTDSDAEWAGRLHDDVERLSFTPEAHAMRERWALGECLSGRARLSSELRDDAIGLLLPFAVPKGSSEDGGTRRKDLFARASRWHAETNALPPLAAEVARVVVRTCRIRLAAMPATAEPRDRLGPARSPEVRHAHP